MIFQDLNNIDLKNIPVIIFGSGPAGITTSLELEKKKIHSLIIEAGSETYNKTSQDFYRGKITGDHLTDISLSRLRQLGGTSGHWGGWSKPMENYSFDSWPIKAKDLEVYTDRTCKILGIKNQFNKSKLNNYFNQIQFQYSNVRFAKKYKKHIKNSKYIHLVLNTQLSHFEGENKVVTNAVCISRNLTKKIQSKYFILSCGGIENSRLMLWSKEKNKTLFNYKLPIGKYYMNHPYYSIGEGLIVYSKYNEYFLNNNILNKPFISCQQQIYFSADKNFLKKNNILNSGIYLDFKVSWKYNSLFKQIRCVAPKYFKKVYEKIKAKEVYEININTLQEQRPEEQNSISLSNNFDPLNIPLSKIYWKRSRSEIKSAKIIAEELGGVFLDNDIGRIALNDYLYGETGEYDVTTGNHQLGGTRMGYSQSDSVVDKNLKVHDVENLYINGSSVFRTGGHNHPTYTIIKLSLRLGDHLKNLKI